MIDNMKIERAGQLNETHILDDVEIELRSMITNGEWLVEGSYSSTLLTAYTRVFARRGMLSDIGLEVLKEYK